MTNHSHEPQRAGEISIVVSFTEEEFAIIERRAVDGRPDRLIREYALRGGKISPELIRIARMVEAGKTDAQIAKRLGRTNRSVAERRREAHLQANRALL